MYTLGIPTYGTPWLYTVGTPWAIHCWYTLGIAWWAGSTLGIAWWAGITLGYTTLYTPGYIPPCTHLGIYTSLGTPRMLVHPAHVRRYPVVRPVPDDEALGSTLRLIRETRRREPLRVLKV